MNFCYYKKDIFLILKIRFLMWENDFLILENLSKFIFNIKNSFSNIKKINDINFINIKFAILEISSLFKNILTEFQVF